MTAEDANLTNPDTPADEDASIMLSALRAIASNGCQWDVPADEVCDCPPCQAERAVTRLTSWRYRAAMAQRLDGIHNPAEARMVAAWRKHMGEGADADRKLEQILRTNRDVTARDWYVATSVIQWLGTNIGSLVVEAAGYQYTKHAEDRKLIDEQLPANLDDLETRCQCNQAVVDNRKPGRCARCGHWRRNVEGP